MHCLHLPFEAIEAVVDVLELGLCLAKLFILSCLKCLATFRELLADDEVTYTRHVRSLIFFLGRWLARLTVPIHHAKHTSIVYGSGIWWCLPCTSPWGLHQTRNHK